MIETRAKSYEGFMTSVPCYAQLLQILFFSHQNFAFSFN